MSDNFWMMADTGPCGPCSEIFYDHGPDIAGGPPGSPDEDGDRYIEIWNHVFMQFDMQDDGSALLKLPAPCVDTGMGLERLAAILQHVHSNYEIDLFEQADQGRGCARRAPACDDLTNPSLRVIADHIRATAFLVSRRRDPRATKGRGYVQRRIIRRAIRHGYKLGQKKPFFHKLVPDLVAMMGDAYPKLRGGSEQRIVDDAQGQEEERFFETLENGMEILDAALAGGAKVLPGEVAFKLHDTFGFPLDLSADVCARARRDGRRSRLQRRDDRSRRPQAARRASSRWTAQPRVQRRAATLFTATSRCPEAAPCHRAVLRRRVSVRQLSSRASRASWCWTPRPSMPRAAARSATSGDPRCGRGRAIRRRRHAEDQGRRVRPPRRADAGRAEGRRRGRPGRRGSPPAPRCATTASPT